MGIAADLALILVAGLFGGLLAQRLGQPLLLGYILGGILVGPNTIGPTVIEVHEIELLAEIGVALLLFALGLELSFRDLQPVRLVALLGAPIQIVLTIGFGYLLARGMFGFEHKVAVWFGALVSLSSTMVVLKTLVAQGTMGTLASRVMIGMLVVQDLAVVPMLILLPRLGDVRTSLPALGLAALQATVFLVLMFVVGTRVMPALLRVIARWKSRELFLVAVVALGVGIGYGTYLFGLSFAFGAFVAGMVLSESEFSHQALQDVIPLRDVFGLVFFASVGMLFDPMYVVRNPLQVIAAVALVVVGKGLIFGVVARVFGYVRAAPYIVAAGLSQVGEFSFLLARQGKALGVLSEDVYSLAITTTLLSMMLTPALLRAAPVVHRRLRRKASAEPARTFNLPTHGIRDHVVLVGYGRTGQAVAEVMRHTGVPHVVVDSDHPRIEDCLRQGTPVIWGDATGAPILAAADLASARLLLITSPDAAGVLRIVEVARELRADVPIIARAPSREQMRALRALGVAEAVQPEFEAGLEMVRQVLSRYDFSPADIHRYSAAAHSAAYEVFAEGRLASASIKVLDELRQVAQGVEIEWLSVPSQSHLVGRTLADGRIRRRTGASVVAVRNEGGLRSNPSPDYGIQAGDLLGILGTGEERSAVRALIEETGPPAAGAGVG